MGYSGSGTFTQSGGVHSFSDPNGGDLYIGYLAGSHGAYNLSGTGQLLMSDLSSEYVGRYGTGTFTQSGGTNAVSCTLDLGLGSGAGGTYSLSGSGALLLASTESVGIYGTGTFMQSGGTNTAVALVLGSGSAGSGTYSLGPNGLLSTTYESVACNSAATGLFQQSGGSNAVATLLSIGSGGRYQLSGGTLQAGGIANAGVFDGSNSPATLVASGVVDLASGTWTNLGATSVNLGANSLLIVPAGFNTATAFGSYSSLGLAYTLGSTLTVPAGRSFSTGGLSINDPVNCQGAILALSQGTINLNNGLLLSGTGLVSLGLGNLTINDMLSGMSGGSLSSSAITSARAEAGSSHSRAERIPSSRISTSDMAPRDNGTYILSGTSYCQTTGTGYGASEYVGVSGTGTLAQTGGANAVGVGGNSSLYLGVNAGSVGTYNLSGIARLTMAGYNTSEIVGDKGAGHFNQSGGSNSCGLGLVVGDNSGSSGVYNLSGSGLLNASNLYLGENAGSSGTLALSQSGVLSATYEYVGYATGAGPYSSRPAAATR